MAELSASTYSETDSSNTAAPPDGLPEGMEFAGVNDAMRALIGSVKRFWGRIQSRYASGGAANAYTLTPDEALAAYVTGERYSFRASFANTGAATLAVSGLSALAIKKMTSAGKVDVVSGDIQSGQPVTVEYGGADLVMVTPAATTTLDDSAVTTAKIANGAVTAAKAADGFTVQSVYAENATYLSATSPSAQMAVAGSDTKPLITEGVFIVSRSITPNKSTNKLRVRITGWGFTLAATGAVALFRDTASTAKRATLFSVTNENAAAPFAFDFEEVAGSVAPTTFSVRFGLTAPTGTMYVNGNSGTRLLGGSSAVTIVVEEITAS